MSKSETHLCSAQNTIANRLTRTSSTTIATQQTSLSNPKFQPSPRFQPLHLVIISESRKHWKHHQFMAIHGHQNKHCTWRFLVTKMLQDMYLLMKYHCWVKNMASRFKELTCIWYWLRIEQKLYPTAASGVALSISLKNFSHRQHYRTSTMQSKANHVLRAPFYHPFQIISKSGSKDTSPCRCYR